MKPSAIAYKKTRIEEAKDGERNAAVRWLESFKANEIVKYQAALELVPKLTQIWYKMHRSPISTHEEIEINRTKEAMFEAWRARPMILQRGKDETVPAGKGKGKNQKAGKGRNRASTNRPS